MSTAQRKKRGTELLQKMLGPEQAKQVRAAWKLICPDFENYVTEFVAGEVWSRPQLDLRTRSLVTVATLAAMGRPLGLELNIRMALNNGATRQEVVETLLHIAPYAGFPACWEGLALAHKVFREADAKADAGQQPARVPFAAELVLQEIADPCYIVFSPSVLLLPVGSAEGATMATWWSGLAVPTAGALTWLAFAICMRYYFRGARKVTPAKTWLTRVAVACTLPQLAVLALVRPPSAELAWAGLVGYAGAHALFWGAVAVHGRKRPAFALLPDTPPALKTSGPYRFVRHPIYSAYLLAWLAGPVATGQFWLFATAGCMAAVFYWAARREEEQLLSGPLAAEYATYRKRTGMFLPRVGF